jgi:hypothetical protein
MQQFTSIQEITDFSDRWLNDTKLLLDIVGKNKVLFGKLVIKLGEVPFKAISSLNNISNKLFLTKLVNADGKLFLHLDSVMQTIESYDIILNLIEYGIFAAFNNKEYFSLMNKIANHNSDNEDFPENKIKFDMRQIIVKGWPQKLIIMCNNNFASVDKIVQYAKEHFKCDVFTTQDSQDIANIVINDNKFTDESELEAKFNTFTNYIRSLNKDLFSRTLLKRPDYDTTYNVHYFQSKLNSDLQMDNISQLCTQLHGVKCIQQINTTNYYIFGNNNNIVNNANPEVSAEDRARNWIRANPPTRNDTKSEYYDRYSASNDVNLNKILFGKLMKKMGFTYRIIGGVHYWNTK